MARKYEELTGIFDFESHVFGTGDDRAIVGRLENSTTVRGKAREDELATGLTYLFRGYWNDHPRYGRQFAFHSFGIAQPVGQRGTVSYLTRGPGIGRKRANLIWERYGQDALEVVRERPKEIAAAIAGLTEEKAKEAAAYFKVHKDREIVTRDLEELLGGGGFPKKLVERLIEKWGPRAAGLIRENAYRLMMFRGVGFGKADKLYLQLGGRPDNAERVGWCIWNALHKDRDGSTWRPVEFGVQAARAGIAGVDVNPRAGLDWAVENRHVAIQKDVAGKEWIAESERAGAEKRLANEVHRAQIES